MSSTVQLQITTEDDYCDHGRTKYYPKHLCPVCEKGGAVTVTSEASYSVLLAERVAWLEQRVAALEARLRQATTGISIGNTVTVANY